MKLSYNNFLRMLIVVVIAMVIVMTNVVNTLQLLGAIIVLGIIVETLCVVRLSSLGYSVPEAMKRLLLKGDKFLVFLNRVPQK